MKRIEINLDNAATTKPDPKVIKAVCDCMKTYDANPSSPYSAAGKSRREIRLTKKLLSQIINCDHSEIIFTSGGTESNNLAIRQAAGKHVILSAIEHKSVLNAAKNQGCQISLVNPDLSGAINPDDVKELIRSDTALISVQFANNETGVLQRVAEIGDIARRERILFHCDAVQAFGHVPVDVDKLNVDLLSASAHKLYGPLGIGFLYMRKGITAKPLILGGKQENNLRAGTENIPAISGFRVACELAAEDMDIRSKKLYDYFNELITRLKQIDTNISVISENTPCLPGVRMVHLPGIDSERTIATLDLKGIRVSGGAACSSSDLMGSHVLSAMGISEMKSREIIRISPGRYNDISEINYVTDAINSLYEIH